ncbi:MAG: hypothetical protein K6G75_06475 [Lachnospiraceae bacterium]|nr:hypothetical protein [Lachnospiraceae bacterium]
MDATAIVCKQCGASIPVLENVGKLVCPSCGTEYILDNENGEKILKEFHFENPFIGVDRIIDPDLANIQERMEMYKEYSNIYNELVKDKEEHSYKYGYWTLRLRAFTEDFRKNFDRYKPFEEVNACVEEHSRLSEFTNAEEDCLAGYYGRNLPILEARVSELKEENESAEKELKKLKSEEVKLQDESRRLSGLIATPDKIKENAKAENPGVYLWYKLCIIFTIAFPIVGIICLITIILIPLGILLILLTIASGIGIKLLSNAIVVVEKAYETKIQGQILQLKTRQNDLLKNINTCKDVCVKSFFEYKHTVSMTNIIQAVLKKFYSEESEA